MEPKDVLIRCSSLGALMTQPKTKAAQEAGELSETAKGVIEDIFLQMEYGYREDIITDAMTKGIMCEQDSIQLVQQVIGGEFRLKNKENFKNTHIMGTPDIILKNDDYIEDTKTAWNLKTFFNSELSKDNWWQGQGYMELTGKRKCRIIYCLVATPPEIILDMQKRVYYKFNYDEENPTYQAICEQIARNNDFSKIPAEHRIKVFEFAYDQDAILKMYVQVERARKYYATLTLNAHKNEYRLN